MIDKLPMCPIAGKGANQCVMAARLGASCVMAGKVVSQYSKT